MDKLLRRKITICNKLDTLKMLCDKMLPKMQVCNPTSPSPESTTLLKFITYERISSFASFWMFVNYVGIKCLNSIVKIVFWETSLSIFCIEENQT